MSSNTSIVKKSADKKRLYDYQINDLNRIFDVMSETADDYNLLYQLPTGGGKNRDFFLKSLDATFKNITKKL